MQKVHGAEQIAAERDKENKENNVVSDVTVGWCVNSSETEEKKQNK